MFYYDGKNRHQKRAYLHLQKETLALSIPSLTRMWKHKEGVNMKSPRDYTLGELETIIRMENHPIYRDTVNDLIQFLQEREKAFKLYAVQAEITEARKKEFEQHTEKFVRTFDDDLLDACVIVE